MRKISKKRQRQEKLYREICKRVDEDPNKHNCIFCNKPVFIADHHHLLGRTGDLFTDESFLFRAHRICHANYHSLPIGKLIEIGWYKDFVNRLESISEVAYIKEVNKIEKS